MVNNKLKSSILDIVENQLKINEPKCTRETVDRLINLGYSENQTKEMIAAVVVEELYDVMKNQDAFNEERYSEKLSQLPEYITKNKNQNSFEDETIQMPIENDPKIGRDDLCPCGSGKKYKKCCAKKSL
jgi:uncharacterized protein YecA (UPF0149 family)